MMICAACGTTASRGSAKFCLVCGKSMSEDYQPLDSLRASYGLQHTRLETTEPRSAERLYEENRNSLAELAYACVVFALVPYLGILFTPAGIIFGGAGYVTAIRKPDLGGAAMAAASVALSILMFAMQLFLWWLLYVIPELGR